MNSIFFSGAYQKNAKYSNYFKAFSHTAAWNRAELIRIQQQLNFSNANMLPSSKCSPLLNIPPVSTQLGHHFCFLENQNSYTKFKHYLNSAPTKTEKKKKKILNDPSQSLHRTRLFCFIVGSPLILHTQSLNKSAK